MAKSLVRSLILCALLLVIVCGVYPGVVTLIGQTLMPAEARGSLVERGGKSVGSLLIGQNFTAPGYLHGRPSAAGDKGYDAANSSGANLGPTNKKLTERIKSDVARSQQENPQSAAAPVPTDLVTASASGLDPHISPAAARYQVARIAAARGVADQQIQDLITTATEQPFLGLIGEPRVNVLAFNLELDKRFAPH